MEREGESSLSLWAILQHFQATPLEGAALSHRAAVGIRKMRHESAGRGRTCSLALAHLICRDISQKQQ